MARKFQNKLCGNPDCGKEYTPTASRQILCPVCSKRKQELYRINRIARPVSFNIDDGTSPYERRTRLDDLNICALHDASYWNNFSYSRLSSEIHN